MKPRRTLLNPGNEPGQPRVALQRFDGAVRTGQFRLGQGSMDFVVANLRAYVASAPKV